MQLKMEEAVTHVEGCAHECFMGLVKPIPVTLLVVFCFVFIFVFFFLLCFRFRVFFVLFYFSAFPLCLSCATTL
ncbi:hypothetical protein DsansV1_C19g0158141 [Dioscorea sansibarensis]